jgi:hypothetical protein
MLRSIGESLGGNASFRRVSKILTANNSYYSKTHKSGYVEDVLEQAEVEFLAAKSLRYRKIFWFYSYSRRRSD